MSLIEAATTAARLRLRPILMTSLAFGLGVVPLMLAMGASAETQHAIGTGVFGGIVSATVLAIFFVPVFFVMVMRFKSGLWPGDPHVAARTCAPARGVMLMRLGVLLLLLLTLQVLVPEGLYLPSSARHASRLLQTALAEQSGPGRRVFRGSTACLAFVQQDRKELLR
jgi:sulfite exporter TauE/SafE